VRILFLTRSFNSLSQRLYLDLTALGHEVAVELDIADGVTLEAVALFKPALIVAPYLTRAIPEAVWRHTLCLIVHPGIVGDRGPSALDWAIAEGESEWGLTVLQAVAELDAGPVWAAEMFTLREANKSSLYRHEVTAAASRAVVAAVRLFEAQGSAVPAAAWPGARGQPRRAMTQALRRIDWARDSTLTVLRKLRAADGAPGVLDALFDTPCHLFDAQEQVLAAQAEPGRVIARCQNALLRTTTDGAVWIGHVRRADGAGHFKLPAALAFPAASAGLPSWAAEMAGSSGGCGWQDIRLDVDGEVLYLHFDFYNGAMSTAQCDRLTAAVRRALALPQRVLVLLGGADFWCNGIHLNVIEAADSPADESWRNIHAMNELTRTLIEATERIVVAAMRGNAGAGGVFMALAADHVWARCGVVLNPHYKNMGNLYGSEYWTYLLPRRLLGGSVDAVMNRRLPLDADMALPFGLVDAVFGANPTAFMAEVRERAASLARRADLPALLHAKQQARDADEARKPLSRYREEEGVRMRRNFYGFDPSYHIARSNFVHRVPASWTPRHLAVHRHSSPAPPAAARSDPDQIPGESGSQKPG
jgi:putative two-component system hydrogenase maturation factor HypX/HoxX